MSSILSNKTFCSKVLLFGEYSVIKNSMALAIPFDLFEGRLAFPGSPSRVGPHCRESCRELKAFYHYLVELCENNNDLEGIDVASFGFDVDQGLFFDSTIPQGFGVGSSGSICAAVYDRYCAQKEVNVLKLKHLFTLMESHFHGRSSGIDPLISYLEKPVLVRSKKEITTVRLPSFNQRQGAIFLLNTGRVRRTEPLVNLFLEKCKQEEFNSFCQNDLKQVTNDCINHFLEGDVENLFKCFMTLSDYQYQFFRPMIPKLYFKIWEDGLQSGHYALKLCGAGGGGFLLGIAKDFKEVSKRWPDLSLRVLYRF